MIDHEYIFAVWIQLSGIWRRKLLMISLTLSRGLIEVMSISIMTGRYINLSISSKLQTKNIEMLRECQLQKQKREIGNSHVLLEQGSWLAVFCLYSENMI